MKILRIRRGFTTNSSAYTEWLPPTGQPGSSVQPPSAQNPATPPPGHAAGNTMTIMGILGALLAVFLTERVIRRLRRRRDADKDLVQDDE